jgi:DNA primase
MAYRRDDIERVRAATDLVELVGEVTKVKRSGRSTMAVCPFHQEKTPSLSIDPARGLYHCFGCGKSGDLFRWVQETQGLEFSDAVELLARRSGIQLTRDPDEAKRRGRREVLIAAVQQAVTFYHDRLRGGDDAGGARSYLRSRGYGAEIAERFALGFSPPDWAGLVEHLRSAGVREEAMTVAGLAIRSRQGRLVDRFRGRLMFPIYDLRGDPVGFGARLLEGDGPKYLNSPETPLYQKSRLLYGLNWAKGDIVREGRSVVVEGYTDVIGMHEAGMPVAVATCGTALGEEHLRLLGRFSERIVLAFDSDAAGTEASLRGAEHAISGELDLRVAVLPAGRDPADLASAGETDLLVKAMDASEPLMRFRIDRELERFDLAEPEARARAVRAAAGIIAGHPDPIARHEYAVQVSRSTGVDLDTVQPAVDAAARASRRGPEGGRAPQRRLTGEEKAEHEVLRLLLANDPGIRAASPDRSWFTVPEHVAAFDTLAPAVAALEPGEPPDLGALLGGDDSDAGRLLKELAMVDRPFGEAGELSRRVQVGALERRIQDLRRRVESLDPAEEGEEYSAVFGELIALERQRSDGGGLS